LNPTIRTTSSQADPDLIYLTKVFCCQFVRQPAGLPTRLAKSVHSMRLKPMFMAIPSGCAQYRCNAQQPKQQKAARALLRAAPDTTADCAVPPIGNQPTKPEMVASGRHINGAPGRPAPLRDSLAAARRLN
ncbi:MAG TPA: hypothetical protein VJ226_13475, partial [Bradyrhizobium sp.]|nr:hypothetical protein [Bradyrhizobium sp.]